MYCKCGNKIPEVRVKMGYRTCINCSNEEKWGCSQIVYHKTGNTIEVIKDKELCEQINAMAERPTFGVSRGMKGNIRKKFEKKSIIKIKKEKEPIPTFNMIGIKAMDINETKNFIEVKKYLKECIKKHWISQYRANKISNIIEKFNNNQ